MPRRIWRCPPILRSRRRYSAPVLPRPRPLQVRGHRLRAEAAVFLQVLLLRVARRRDQEVLRVGEEASPPSKIQEAPAPQADWPPSDLSHPRAAQPPIHCRALDLSWVSRPRIG